MIWEVSWDGLWQLSFGHEGGAQVSSSALPTRVPREASLTRCEEREGESHGHVSEWIYAPESSNWDITLWRPIQITKEYFL